MLPCLEEEFSRIGNLGTANVSLTGRRRVVFKRARMQEALPASSLENNFFKRAANWRDLGMHNHLFQALPSPTAHGLRLSDRLVGSLCVGELNEKAPVLELTKQGRNLFTGCSCNTGCTGSEIQCAAGTQVPLRVAQADGPWLKTLTLTGCSPMSSMMVNFSLAVLSASGDTSEPKSNRKRR